MRVTTKTKKIKTHSGIISALFLAYSSLLLASPVALAQNTTPKPAAAQSQGNVLELTENAPDRHVVVSGDTLWGISGLFLKQPWRWPEIWRLNKEQIKNPHWIYPGQIVYLDRSGTEPQLRIGNPVGSSSAKASPRVYSKDNQQAIQSIPQKAIEPFLSQPLVIEAGALDHAPRIVATQEDRVVVGAGNTAYATGIDSQQPLWQIYRPGKELVDPDNGQVLGHEALYLGSARLLRAGEPATLEILKSKQEIGLNDRLIPAPRPDIINYVPHAPDTRINSRIMSVYGGVAEGASHSIITLSRGAQDGLEVGHVLNLSRSGVKVGNRYQDQAETWQLPDERYGFAFVFRVFDRVAYALVMNVTRPVIVGDSATNP
ncbi:MAG: LysM peptidoglycan-binding domain-containing protein [Sterolibacterium sp.]|jgi:hypothetical protein|nr:LysM peptidoglycan-binding domain-containing protein [Sterolibacterium sp.]